MSELRKAVIKLANDNPKLRPQLLSLLKEGGDLSKLPPALRENVEKKQEEAKKKKEKESEKKATNTDLREAAIKLAHGNQELRSLILPFLKEGGDLSKLPPALREQAEKKKEEGKKNKEKEKESGKKATLKEAMNPVKLGQEFLAQYNFGVTQGKEERGRDWPSAAYAKRESKKAGEILQQFAGIAQQDRPTPPNMVSLTKELAGSINTVLYELGRVIGSAD